MKSSKINIWMLLGAALIIGGVAFFLEQPESTSKEIAVYKSPT